MSVAFVGRVVVYTITGCPHCLAAKALLRDKSIPYLEVNVNQHPEVVEWLRGRTQKTSVPQIFFNRTHIGGNKELQAVGETQWKSLVADLINNPAPDDSDPLVPDSFEHQLSGGGVDSLTCEPDDDLVLMADLRESTDLVSKASSNCFVRFLWGKQADSVRGSDMVKFIEDTRKVTPEEALKKAERLLEKGLLTSTSPNLKEFDTQTNYYLPDGIRSSIALNADVEVRCAPRALAEVGEALRKTILQIHADFLSEDGRRVDYAGIKDSPAFKSYKDIARQLQNVEIEGSSENQRLAFFINVYNALVIHGFIERGDQPRNHLQRYLFFSRTCYNIGGRDYSLNDIENGVLRANRPSFGTLYSTPFKSGDPRLKTALASVEPRVHFALNCGAASCPPIKTFSGDKIDKELDLATEAFLENDEGLKVSESSVYLSMLFNWYKVDFGRNQGEILRWISTYAPSEKRSLIEKLVASDKFNIEYNNYDWGDNAKSD